MFGNLANISTRMFLLEFKIYSEDSCKHRKLVVRNEEKFFELAKKLGIKPAEYDLKANDKSPVSWSDQVVQNGVYALYPKGLDASEINESDGEDRISLPSDTSAIDDTMPLTNATQQTTVDMEESKENHKRYIEASVNSTQSDNMFLPSTSFDDHPLLNEMNKTPIHGSGSPNDASTPINESTRSKQDVLNTSFANESSIRQTFDHSVQFNDQVEKLQRSVNQLKVISIVQSLVIVVLFVSLMFAIFYPMYAHSSPTSRNKRWV